MQVLCQFQAVKSAIIRAMILITGGTGFIGKELVRQLVEVDKPFRLLIQPSTQTPDLPLGVNLDIAICSLNDEKGLKAALKGIDVIYHFATVEQTGISQNELQNEIDGVETLVRAAPKNIQRIFYLSHLGADRASAFQLLKAKGVSENVIKNSQLTYTIIRSSMIYGPGDLFTQNLAKLIRLSPGVTLLPGDGSVLLQPVWVEDLVNCVVWASELPGTQGQIVEIGGPEHLSFLEILEQIAGIIKRKRRFVPVNPTRLRTLALYLESMFKNFPKTAYYMDYLAENRICALDSIPRIFGISPARFRNKINYLASPDQIA